LLWDTRFQRLRFVSATYGAEASIDQSSRLLQEEYAVDPEMIIVEVSTFVRTFEDLQRQAGESGICFTGLLKFAINAQKYLMVL
jgi:hypothetical protein